MRKVKGSLIYEIVACIFTLIALFTLGILIPFARYRIHSIEKTLTFELQSRIDMLLSTISVGAEMYMPTGNTMELSLLANKISNMPEVQFTTVTGFCIDDDFYQDFSNRSSARSYLHVWTTNDESILQKIDTQELIPGVSCLVSEQFIQFDELCRSVNEDVSLFLKEQYSFAHSKIEDDDVVLKLNRALDEFVDKQCIPSLAFNDLHAINTSYLFYRPIVFYVPHSSDFVHGLVLVGVDISSLISSVDESLEQFMTVIIIVASLIFLVCAFGFFMIARYIVRPIRLLESFALHIATEKHKETLSGERKNIKINRNDELGRLGDAMNQLKEELASDALAEKLMNDGKIVQKAFLPLNETKNGLEQKTTASYSDKNIITFGYYEGASGVSGDYFDYKKLNERWYAFIKSDASGHGTAAGLIMTVVATLFNAFFDGWSAHGGGKNITRLVYQINDFLESLPLHGKFATIILILYDSKSGKAYMCNAGDNIMHIYRAKKSCMQTLFLKESPAAGPFSSSLVNRSGGFVQEEVTLDHGDILFLYTDGIEESMRLVRDAKYKVVHTVEDCRVVERTESFGSERIGQVIEAVFSRSKFVLKKEENPAGDENLVFDFSNCEGSCCDAIIALVSIEKVFRMYKPASASDSDRIYVDKKIDLFLKNHFNLYETYCSPVSSQENDTESEYTIYRTVLEDDQRDDLTIFALKRP
ncbi:MAG: SpoIIE family protein phosphatase [Treponema sp.]|nr:SpoIIE family protein phosphatase [Treponema sp.]